MKNSLAPIFFFNQKLTSYFFVNLLLIEIGYENEGSKQRKENGKGHPFPLMN